MNAVHQPGLASHWKKVALLGGGSAIFVWQFWNPIIRFEWPVANLLIGFAWGLSLPWLTVVGIFRIGRWWSKAIALIAVIPLLLYSAVFLMGSVMIVLSYENGRDLSFERFAEADWKGSKVCFYRTDGGVLSDFGVVIRQERSLLPGVLLVRQVDRFYPCVSLDAASTDIGITVRDGHSACRSFHEQRREYRLKPFLYF